MLCSADKSPEDSIFINDEILRMEDIFMVLVVEVVFVTVCVDRRGGIPRNDRSRNQSQTVSSRIVTSDVTQTCVRSRPLAFKQHGSSDVT